MLTDLLPPLLRSDDGFQLGPLGLAHPPLFCPAPSVASSKSTPALGFSCFLDCPGRTPLMVDEHLLHYQSSRRVRHQGGPLLGTVLDLDAPVAEGLLRTEEEAPGGRLPHPTGHLLGKGPGYSIETKNCATRGRWNWIQLSGRSSGPTNERVVTALIISSNSGWSLISPIEMWRHAGINLFIACEVWC